MDDYTGGMLALVPSNPDALTVRGGDPASQLHLTLMYLGDDVTGWDEDRRRALAVLTALKAKRLPPVKATVFGHATFNPDDPDRKPCAVYVLNGDFPRGAVRSIAFDVLDGGELPDEHPTFIPHVTAGYEIPVSRLSYTGPVTFDTLRLALGNEVHDFPLTGEPERSVSMAAVRKVLNLSAKTAGYSAASTPLGPGNLWHTEGAQLPNYIRNVAKGIMKSGRTRSQAIQIAIGKLRDWASGRGNVSPEVRAASIKALAEFEAMRAKAKATPNKSDHAAARRALELAWNEAAHPRAKAGSPQGGQFVPVGKARDAEAAQAQKDTGAQRNYAALQGGQVDLTKLSDDDLQKLTRIFYSFASSDPKIVAARIRVANEMSKRGFDIQRFGALGGGKPAKAAGDTGRGDPKMLAAEPVNEVTLAAVAGHHVAGTAFHWFHNWRPRDVATALLWKKHNVAKKLHQQGANHFNPEPDSWWKAHPHLKQTLHIGDTHDAKGGTFKVEVPKAHAAAKVTGQPHHVVAGKTGAHITVEKPKKAHVTVQPDGKAKVTPGYSKDGGGTISKSDAAEVMYGTGSPQHKKALDAEKKDGYKPTPKGTPKPAPTVNKTSFTPAKKSAAKKPAGAASTPATKGNDRFTPISTDGWKKISGAKGSNEGGEYEAPDGTRYYVKVAKSDDHARNEALAAELYKAAGVESADVRLATVDGKTATASRMIPDAQNDFSTRIKTDPAYKVTAQRGFATDAWLANWDVVGLKHDNIVTNEGGYPVRVDPGGALLFRAQGKPKGTKFGNTVGEWETLRNGVNPQTAAVFGDMTPEQLKESAKKVEAVTPEQIDAAVDKAGFDKATADKLKATLKARREDVLKRAAATKTPKAAPKSTAPKGKSVAAQKFSKAKAAEIMHGTGSPQHNKALAAEGKPPATAPAPKSWASFDTYDEASTAANATVGVSKKPLWIKQESDGKFHLYSEKPPGGASTQIGETPPEPVGGKSAGKTTSQVSSGDYGEITSHYAKNVKWTTAEYNAADAYSQTFAYAVNKKLRVGLALTASDKKQMAALDSLAQKYSLPKTVTVHRGFHGAHFPTTNLTGKVYEDPGYGSTTFDKAIAFGGDVKWEVTVPAGTHGISANGMGGLSHPSEKEFILPRGTKYLIESDQTVGGKRVIKATVVPADVPLPETPELKHNEAKVHAPTAAKGAYSAQGLAYLRKFGAAKWREKYGVDPGTKAPSSTKTPALTG